jgi:hypothetical protein
MSHLSSAGTLERFVKLDPIDIRQAIFDGSMKSPSNRIRVSVPLLTTGITDLTKINRLDSVTRHPMLSTNIPQFRYLFLADVNRYMTSGIEVATAGGINRAGYITS